MSTVLCIDDEPAILRLLSVVLAADGHEVMTATAGREALTIIGRGAVDAVLLDLGLADRDGLELIPAIRAITAVPILVISARGEVAEKVTALDLGAADYITKPFDGDEVRARLRVALRQGAKSLTPDGVICHGPIRMNPERHEAEVSGRPLSLTPKEYALLKALIEAKDRKSVV